MKRLRLLIFFLPVLMTALPLSAQVDTKKSSSEIAADVASALVDTKTEEAPAPEPPKPTFWKKGILTSLSFSQTSLTNWAAGGDGNVTLNAYIDATADYAKNKWIWDNRFQAGYGFLYSLNQDEKYRYKKSDDRLQIDSEVGRQVSDRLYLSGLFTFKTQWTDGHPYSGDNHRISSFMAPGYINIGIGIDYKPFKCLSIYASPLTGNFVVVAPNDSSMRVSYGNKFDQAIRAQMGAQVKMDLKYSVQNFNINSTLNLFSNYLDKPQNIQVNWDLNCGLKIWKVLTISLRTSLIYDDNIKIADKDGNKAPRVQFKEIGGIGITYIIGNYTKR